MGTWKYDRNRPTPLPEMGPISLLLTSDGHHWRPVQTCLLQDSTPTNTDIWWIPKHILLASGQYVSYWNSVLFFIHSQSLSFGLLGAFLNHNSRKLINYADSRLCPFHSSRNLLWTGVRFGPKPGRVSLQTQLDGIHGEYRLVSIYDLPDPGPMEGGGGGYSGVKTEKS